MDDPRHLAREEYWGDRSADGWHCPGCGRSIDEVADVHVHHRDGRAHHNDRDNHVALCARCHLGGRHDNDAATPDASGPPAPRATGPPSPGGFGPP